MEVNEELISRDFIDRAIVFVLRILGSLQFLLAINLFMLGWIFIQHVLKHPFDVYPYNLLQTVMTVVMANIDVFILVASLAQQRLAKKQEMVNIQMMQEIINTTKILREMAEKDAEREERLEKLLEKVRDGG